MSHHHLKLLFVSLFFALSCIATAQSKHIHSIFFDSNSSSPRTTDSLSGIARYLAVNTTASLTITGHTDSIGSQTSNMTLANRRAKAVAQFFATQGIAPNRLQTLAKGEDYPVAGNDTESGRQKNRRAEIHLINPEVQKADTATDSTTVATKAPDNISGIRTSNLPRGVQGEIDVSDSVLVMLVRDWHIVDGDVVNIYINETIVVEDLLVTEDNQRFVLRGLGRGRNSLVVTVMEEGGIPGASPGIEIIDGDKSYKFEIKSRFRSPGIFYLNF